MGVKATVSVMAKGCLDHVPNGWSIAANHFYDRPDSSSAAFSRLIPVATNRSKSLRRSVIGIRIR